MGKIENQELLDQAEELDLDTNDFDSEDDLKKAIDEKLESESADEDDVEALKEKIEFQKKEAKKAFDARDRAKKDQRKLKSKLDEQQDELDLLKEKLDNAPNVDEFNKLKKQFEEIEKEREEKELEKLDDAEKERVRFQKKLDSFEDKMNNMNSDFTSKIQERDKALAESKKEIANLRKARLGADIVRLAAKHKAYNPEQIEKLLVGDFIYDDKLESYSFLERDTKGKIVDEKSVEDRVKEFLEDPDNDNLVRSTAKAGMGAKETGTGKSSNAADDKSSDTGSQRFNKMTRKLGEYDPKDPALKAEADDKGMTVEELIDILKIRDAKLMKIKGIKTEDK